MAFLLTLIQGSKVVIIAKTASKDKLLTSVGSGVIEVALEGSPAHSLG